MLCVTSTGARVAVWKRVVIHFALRRLSLHVQLLFCVEVLVERVWTITDSLIAASTNPLCEPLFLGDVFVLTGTNRRCRNRPDGRSV